ncbi:MAG: beta-galactosidase [Proteobacteria bacterium]|nr:beta-galactosidase [Pseudomonadota bacterium]
MTWCLRWLLIAAACAWPQFVLAAPPTLAAAAPAAKLPAARLDGNYFMRDGRRFLVVGAHWVPAKAAMQWPLQWDPQDIEADFAQMQRMGFNTVRLDLMWAWFEPRPGDYNPEAFAQFDALLALAHKYHIYLHPSLFVGGEVGEAYWDVPWRMGRNPQSDPEMLRLETNQAQEFGRRYAHETAILAWDLTDEPPFWIAPGTTDAMAVNWTRLIGGGLRKYDQLHPIVAGVSTQDMEHGPFRPDTIAADVDFFSVHPYTIYTPDLFPDPMVAERSTYGAAFETTLSRDAGRPVMVQEMGASSAQYSPENIVAFDQVSLYSALGAGANGFLLWCYTDAAPEQYRKVPYLRSPHETQFGLTTWDRQMRPQGLAFQAFSKIVAHMDLDGLAVPPADAAIIIPEEWSRTHGDFSRFGLKGPEVTPYVSVAEGGAVNGQEPTPYDGNQWVMSSTLSAFILAHRAGLKPSLPREASDWERFPLLLLPSPLTATDPVFVHLHTDFWERARAYVNGGGVLYASLAANGAIPEMSLLFGARMTDTVIASEVTLKIVKPLGSLKAGDRFHFTLPGSAAKYWGTGLQVSDGEVIAVDQDNRPALIAHRYGKGRTLLSAYPLEAWLGSQPAAFEGNELNYRLYRALREWSGVRALVSTDQASVEASALTAKDRGYFVLANHSPASLRTHVDSTLPARDVRQLGEDASVAVAVERGGWSVTLPPHSGAVLEFRMAPQ